MDFIIKTALFAAFLWGSMWFCVWVRVLPLQKRIQDIELREKDLMQAVIVLTDAMTLIGESLNKLDEMMPSITHAALVLEKKK